VAASQPAGDGRARQVLVDLLACHDGARAGDWADRLIATFGGAAPALAADPLRLAALLDPGAAALIVAHRRATLWTLREAAVRRPIFATRHALIRYLHHAMAHDPVECLRALFVNVRRELIAEEEIARGVPDALAVEPRQVLSRALAWQAHGILLVHNHPGGDPRPSVADRRFTQRLALAADGLGMRLHDHLIVARDGHAAIRIASVTPDDAAPGDVLNP
jgi:DNA repair protein RadC